MSDLPEGWDLATLEELAAPEERSITDGPFGSNLKTAHYTDDGPRVIRLQNIGDGNFLDERAHISEEHFETLRAHEAKAGDLVVASLGADLPRACIVPESVGPAIVKADCIRVRLHPEINTRYVNYALQRPDLRHAVADQIHGVGRPRLGMKGIRAVEVPVPPRNEQERIVEAIEAHLSRLTAAEDQLRLCERRTESLAQRIVDCSLEGEPTRLGDLLAEPLRNGLSSKASTTGEVKVLTLTAVTDRRFEDANTKLIDTPDRPIDDLWLREGDIFIQRSNTPELVGSAALYSGPSRWAIFPDLLIRLRVDRERADPAYIDIALRSSRLRSYFRRRAQGIAGSMPKISQPVVEEAELPLPSLQRQRELVDEFNLRIEALGRHRAVIESALRRSSSLQRSVLAAAFSGQLVPQDPSDEPSSELLERIRVERPTKKSRSKENVS